MIHTRNAIRGALALGASVLASGSAAGQLAPEWFSQLPAGSALSAGLAGMVVSDAGVAFITGNTGPSGNTDAVTAAFAPDGTLLWSHVFNGAANGHDQARGIAMGPGGVVYVCGNTRGPGGYGNVLLLKYDAATGALLNTVQYSSAPFTAEHGASVATDAAGNVFVGGGTVGDGSDCLTIKFNPAGQVQWTKTWDGPAFGPFSQESVRMIAVAPDGNPVIMTPGVMGSQHADYVLVKYASADGAVLWQSVWGMPGGDAPRDMVFDAAGDVYVTGVAFDFIDQFGTIKVRGTDGGLVWQAYDAMGFDNVANAVTLDGAGGVYITGSWDPDGNSSNFNDNFRTVKRDAATGAFLWSHTYGDTCVGCFDVGADVIVDGGGNVFVTGQTSSAPYNGDMILFLLDDATGVELQRGAVSAAPSESLTPGILRLDGAQNLYAGGRLYHANTGAVGMAVLKFPTLAQGCYADCNGDAALNLADFGCFQTKFATGDPYADCNGDTLLNLADFGCFQTQFALGCP